MRKLYLVLMFIFALIFIWLFLRFIIGGNEDDWIKNSEGVWVKHGNPAKVPDYVVEQQNAIKCAKDLYNQQNKSILSSQCLGTCLTYSVDIVHVPRIEEDNLPENQCSDYRNGKTSKFIELDKEGEIQRIV